MVSQEQKHALILKFLLDGGRVKIGPYVYLMATVIDDAADFDLCTLAYDQNDKEHYLRTHMTIGQFCKLVDKMTEEEYGIAAAQAAEWDAA